MCSVLERLQELGDLMVVFEGMAEVEMFVKATRRYRRVPRLDRPLPHHPTTTDTVRFADLLDVLAAIDRDGLEVIETEHLYEFDGVSGFSLGQGQ
ncbi:hypothetical protein BH24ACT5_BH24ACT5_20530 [soil metagenome]